jgi:hypothetical protein
MMFLQRTENENADYGIGLYVADLVNRIKNSRIS